MPINQNNKSEIKGELVKIFGANNVTDSEINLLPYSYDATEQEPHMPDFVCIVENTEQVSRVIHLATKYE